MITLTVIHNYYKKKFKSAKKNKKTARHRWLTPVILVTQEADIRKITV
jgi:hypothetical protein